MLLRNELVSYCHRVHQQGFVAATDGNLSLRQADGSILITASGRPKGEITPEDIIQCSPGGATQFGKRKYSTESKLHFHIYRNRPDIGAVIHCHPPAATAFATSQKTLDLPVLPEIVLTLGRIPLCPYATPSTDALPASLDESLAYANVFLLANHGAVATGKTIAEAYNRMEKLEHYAKFMLYAESLGGPRLLTRAQLDDLYRLAPGTYGLHIHEKNRY
jgi:L-fuculose-phosphate aldolase